MAARAKTPAAVPVDDTARLAEVLAAAPPLHGFTPPRRAAVVAGSRDPWRHPLGRQLASATGVPAPQLFAALAVLREAAVRAELDGGVGVLVDLIVSTAPPVNRGSGLTRGGEVG